MSVNIGRHVFGSVSARMDTHGSRCRRFSGFIGNEFTFMKPHKRVVWVEVYRSYSVTYFCKFNVVVL